MSVIIRLQNLPWSANAADVRGFFRGLSIPDGGVHIVGGENGDAFIAFSTDEDARQAMMLTGSKLKEIQVTLLLSSRAEMQKVIELARQTTVSFIQLSAPTIQPQPPIIPASLSGFLAQQMVQQNQHSPVLQPNIIPEIAPIVVNDTKKIEVKKSRKSDRDRRSRSKSRDRRRRSRSRDRSFRRRDRSKSKDRRRSSRRSKSRDRNRSRDRSSRDKDRKPVVPIVKQLNVPPPILPVQNFPQIPINNPDYIWDVPPNNFQGNLPFINNIPMNMPIMTQMPPIYKPTELNIAPLLFTSNTAAVFNKYDMPPQIPIIKTEGKSIKISNLDLSTSYSEIRRFFGSLIAKDGVKMINDRLGRRTGSAVILFQQLNAKIFAMRKSGQILKNSVILVEEIDDNEYFNAVDNFKPSKSNYSNNSINRPQLLQRSNDDDDVVIINDENYENNIFTTLIIEDIPSFTKEQDIIKMFSDITLKDVIIGKKFNELQAYAKFYQTEDAKLALNNKSTHFVGYKNVTVSICSDLVFDNAKHDFEQIIDEKPIEQKYPTDPRQKNRFTGNLRNDENNWNENNETDRNNIPDIRNFNFNNQNRFNNQNQNFNNHQNQNNQFNDNRMNNRPNFNNRNRFNDDNNQYNNRRNDNFDNSDDRQFNRPGNFHQRSYNNNQFNGNRQQEFNQRFQNNENQSFNDDYDNQNDNDDHQQNNFNDDDQNNKINDHDENSDENNGSVIVIPDDPTDDDNPPPIGDDSKQTKIDEKSIIDENIENSMEEIHTEQPIQDSTEEIPNISDCIILQNLHSNTTEKDVINFFADVEIIPVNVHMLLDTDNQPSGDCFCEFNNVNDAERAFTKNMKNIGPNSIKIEFISRFKVDEIISSFNKIDEIPTNNHDFNDQHQYQNDFPNFRQGNNNLQNNYNNGGGHNNYNNGPNNYNNNHRGGDRGGGRFNNNNSRNNNNRFNSVGNNRNILNLTNIPYRANALDILDFFSGFDLTEDDVVRRYNDFGKPTADARITFLTIDDAREAFEACNGKRIGGRAIHINFN